MSCLQLKTDAHERRTLDTARPGPWQVQAARDRPRVQYGYADRRRRYQHTVNQAAAATDAQRCANLARVRARYVTQKMEMQEDANKTHSCGHTRGKTRAAPQAATGTLEPRKRVKDHDARHKQCIERRVHVAGVHAAESASVVAVEPKNCTRSRATSICCPSLFLGDAFRSKVELNRTNANQRWIFDLIRGEFAPNELVFLNEADWILVQGNSHSVYETRYLVIFKDTSLQTIRDLRQVHLPMLSDMWRKVTRFVSTRHGTDAAFQQYFHYLPSVFQLHMHVCSSGPLDVNRTQRLSCVMRNIRAVDTWYRDALILFAAPRTTRSSPAISTDRGADKHVRVCI
jgi:hypothetical protein